MYLIVKVLSFVPQTSCHGPLREILSMPLQCNAFVRTRLKENTGFNGQTLQAGEKRG